MMGRWLVLLAVLSGCATVLPPRQQLPARAGSPFRVAVLVSETNPIYDETLRGFTAAFQGAIEVYSDINEDHTSTGSVRSTVAAFHPDLVVTLGDAAARLTWEARLEVPALFAVVVSPEELGIMQGGHFFGVSMVTTPGAAFTRFKSLAPNMKRIVAFYDEASTQTMLGQAKAELALLGLELEAVKISGVDDMKEHLTRKRATYDAVWMVQDPIVVNKEAFDVLRVQSLMDHKLLLTTINEKFTEAGATMTVSADFAGMGGQAALLAFRVLGQKVDPSKIGLHPPVGAKLSANLTTAAAIGLDIPLQAMTMLGRAYK